MAWIVDVPELLARLGIEGKRRGREVWACCPLHEERTPSWQIRDDEESPERHGRWRCLGACHTGGSPTGLVMQLLGLGAREAWAWIKSGAAREAVPPFEVEIVPGPPLRGAMRLPRGVIVAPLCEWPSPARDYLVRDRGVTEDQVERWGLGYAVDGRLAGRVVMPWRDERGKLLGYTARTFVDDAKKYLEPDSDEGAEKSAVYGEEHWQPPGHRDTLVVVEGGFDGYAVERATGLPFGALRGSQLLPGHLARLSTWQRVVIASDPDKAGKGLADALADALARYAVVTRPELPAGRDVAKIYMRDGAEAVARLLGVQLEPAPF